MRITVQVHPGKKSLVLVQNRTKSKKGLEAWLKW
jgi:hypothetical protein